MTGSLLIMLASLLWAIDTLFRYPLLGQGVSTLQIVFFEHLLLVALMLPWLWRRGQLAALTNRRFLPGFLLIGGLGSAIGTLAFTKAFTLLNPSLVILLQKLQPVIAISLAALWLKEPISRRFLRWAALCFAGSFLMMHQDLQALFSTEALLHGAADGGHYKALAGAGLAMLAVIAWGSATVCGKHLTQQQLPGDTIMGGRFLMGLLVLLPLWLWQYPLTGTAQPATVSVLSGDFLQPLIAMVLLSGLLGMAVYYQGLQRIPARLGALAEMFFPVAAITVNWLVLGVELEALQLLGAALLILGSLQVQRHAQPASPQPVTQG